MVFLQLSFDSILFGYNKNSYIYIYVKTFQKHIPDDITLEYTVYVALLEKKFTLHLLSLFTTPLLGMTKTIALA